MKTVHVHRAGLVSETTEFDLFVCALGFESRATNAYRQLGSQARRRVAFGFCERQVLAFDRNVRTFKDAKFDIRDVPDREFRAGFKESIEQALPDRGDCQIAVDVSCFDRHRIALIVDVLRSLNNADTTLVVSFLYSLAAYSPPPTEQPANVHAGPVTSEFAGWTTDPTLPPAAIVGLGYEQDKALGAIDHLQAANVFALIPTSSIGEYLTAVEQANASLLSELKPRSVLRYRVEDPVSTYTLLESITNWMKVDFNPVLLPFGPKIFFVCSVLTACRHPEAAVWRMSAGASEQPVDRQPSDVLLSLSVSFQQPTLADAIWPRDSRRSLVTPPLLA